MPLPGERGGRGRGRRWRQRSGRWRLVRGPAGEREERRGDAAYLALSRLAGGRPGGWPGEVSVTVPGLPRPGGGLRARDGAGPARECAAPRLTQRPGRRERRGAGPG